jgi:hypothetical protein
MILKIEPNHRVAKFWLRDKASKMADAAPQGACPEGIDGKSPSNFKFPDESEWQKLRKADKRRAPAGDPVR